MGRKERGGRERGKKQERVREGEEAGKSEREEREREKKQERVRGRRSRKE